MRIFNQYSQQSHAQRKVDTGPEHESRENKLELKKRSRIRPNISDGEIRDKIARAKMKSDVSQTEDKIGKSQFHPLSEASSTPVELSVDQNNNDPNNPIVLEKLKGALSAGIINFNPQEREVLGKILQG